MGGIGSGNRFRWGSRSSCEASLRIDLRYMRKRGMLRAGSSGTLSWSRNGEQVSWIRYRVHAHSLELDYRTRVAGDEWTPVNERVPLMRHDQPFGGTRLFIQCLRCRRRCLVLYGGTHFRCRTCLNLTYDSQNQDLSDRASAKSRQIRARLGGDGCFEDPIPAKPKGMHWKTYRKLERECEFQDGIVAAQFIAIFARLGGRI